MTLLVLGVWPVTCWISDTKSRVVRCTPGQSSVEMKTGEAFPPETIANDDLLFVNDTQPSCPIDRAPGARESTRQNNAHAKTVNRILNYNGWTEVNESG